MDKLVFDTARIKDIPELVRLRIAYMIDDYGSVSDADRRAMEEQLPGYFERKLGRELVAFVARDGEHLVATVYLLIIEKPANPAFLNGLEGEVLNVFTEKEYRGRGISTRLLNEMIAYAKEKQLCRIDLKATDEGYKLYKKLGFVEITQKYVNMRLKL
ncbi:MAG: GNAT family N-acetyltransferase [Lachnospiraceae bacterium]|nr:GNAT family N-acetyltransferase [Lachnospiraceae bacterium]